MASCPVSPVNIDDAGLQESTFDKLPEKTVETLCIPTDKVDLHSTSKPDRPSIRNSASNPKRPSSRNSTSDPNRPSKRNSVRKSTTRVALDGDGPSISTRPEANARDMVGSMLEEHPLQMPGNAVRVTVVNLVEDEDHPPVAGMINHIKVMITPSRVIVTLACIIFLICGVLLIDPDEWNVTTTIPNVRDEAACRALCEQSSNDDALAQTIGGKGICSTLSFKYCETKAKYPKLKLKDCESFDANVTADPTKDSTKCRFAVSPAIWKPYVTIIIFAVAVEGCFDQLPPEVMMLGGATVLTIIGIITRSQLFGGLSNKGVLGLAMLSPIAEAIGDSGIMEKLVSFLLGSPSSLVTAIPRMMGPVVLLSAFLSNTATVAILIPIIVSWSRRLECHPGKLLMPLSFAAQLGGSMTLLGSSHCLVAQSQIDSSLYDMGFFDLFPIGTLLMLTTCVIVWLVVLKTPLLKSSAGDLDADDGAELIDVYDYEVVVTGGGLVGKSIADSGLTRLPGIGTLRKSDGTEGPMKRGDVLVSECDERGVVALRAAPGLTAPNQKDLVALGRNRHRRYLYEVKLRKNGEFLGEDGSFPCPEDLREDFGACFVAGPKRLAERATDNKLRAMAWAENVEFAEIKIGSILLVEADERIVVNSDSWLNAFELVLKVPGSATPRQGLPVDVWRGFGTFIAFLALIGLMTAKLISLDYGGALLVLFYLLIDAISLKRAMKSFRPSILLTIAGALSMGEALKRVGVVNFLANKMVALAEGNVVGLTAIIYFIAVFLSCFINNSATVAILAPMLETVVEKDESIKIQGLVWTLVYSAGTCFTTPLGYQTNLMVMPEGRYTFGDFARFGVPSQLLHFVFTLVFVLIFTPLLVPD